MAVVAVLVGVAIGLVPIRNPGVQDCGTPIAYLLDGRVNSYPDASGRLQRPDGTIATLSKAEIDRAFHHQCSARVGSRMVPVAVLITTGALLGLVVLLVSMVVWWRTAPVRPRPADPPGAEPPTGP